MTTVGCVCVQQETRSTGGGRRAVAFSHETATPGWGRHSFAVPSSVGRAQVWNRGAMGAHPTVYRGVAGSSPVGSAGDPLGFCSSPVERLVEAQRAAGSIPAEAILEYHAAVAERQTRDAQNVVGSARESSSLSGGMAVQGSSAGERPPHKPRRTWVDLRSPSARIPPLQSRSCSSAGRAPAS